GRILRRKLSNGSSCAGRNHGRVPPWKTHTSIRLIAGSSHWDNTVRDRVVDSCANQNVIVKPAPAHIYDERTIPKPATDLEIRQICNAEGGNGGPKRTRTMCHDRDDGCLRRNAVETAGERRVRKSIAETKDDACDRCSVSRGGVLPRMRLL